jgi:homoserine kinase type II
LNEVFETVRAIVDGHYDIGRLVRAEPIDKGYINVSYRLVIRHEGRETPYILRRYRSGTDLARIRFEHALMGELERNGFTLTPVLIPTRAGDTLVEADDHLALFSFLEGDEPYAWDRTGCDTSEIADAARVLADYHRTLRDWKPPGLEQGPRLVDSLPTFAADWSALEPAAKETEFGVYFFSHRPGLVDRAVALHDALPRSIYDTLPHVAVHGDFHPGNLKFRNGAVVGLFDFDWAKIDARCFDVALAATYFCAVWDNDGGLDTKALALFLGSYQQQPDPLGGVELHWLPALIEAANLYVLSWTIGDFFRFRPAPAEYLRYLRHGVRLARWLEDRREELAGLIVHC